MCVCVHNFFYEHSSSYINTIVLVHLVLMDFGAMGVYCIVLPESCITFWLHILDNLKYAVQFINVL